MHSNLEELAAKDEKPHTNNTKQTWFERVVLLVAILKKEKIYFKNLFSEKFHMYYVQEKLYCENMDLFLLSRIQ